MILTRCTSSSKLPYDNYNPKVILQVFAHVYQSPVVTPLDKHSLMISHKVLCFSSSSTIFMEFKWHILPLSKQVHTSECWVSAGIPFSKLFYLYFYTVNSSFWCTVLQARKYTDYCNHHHNQDTEQFYHFRTLPWAAPLESKYHPPPTSRNHLSLFQQFCPIQKAMQMGSIAWLLSLVPFP